MITGLSSKSGARKGHLNKGIRFTYSGVKEMIDLLNGGIPHELKIGIALGTSRASHHLLKIADKYVPVHTGALRASGKVLTRASAMGSNIVYSKNKYVVGVGYYTKYAYMVHEILKRHGTAYNAYYATPIANRWKGYSKKRPKEQAFFMEKAMREGAPRIEQIIKTDIGRALKRVKLKKNFRKLTKRQILAVTQLSNQLDGFSTGW